MSGLFLSPADERQIRQECAKTVNGEFVHTHVEIARRHSVSPSTVSVIAKKAGLPPRYQGRGKPRRESKEERNPQMFACSICGMRSTSATHELCSNRQAVA